MSERIHDIKGDGLRIANLFVRRSEVLDVFTAINCRTRNAESDGPLSVNIPCIPNLPDDATILSCYYDHSRDGFIFQVQSCWYDEVAPWEVPSLIVPHVGQMTREIWLTAPANQHREDSSDE